MTLPPSTSFAAKPLEKSHEYLPSPQRSGFCRGEHKKISLNTITRSATMSLRIFFQTSISQTESPYRLLEDRNGVDWANEFLDAQKIRGLSLCSLRAYAYDLLNLAQWFSTASVKLPELNQPKLFDYIRFQWDHQPQPAAQTVNHRITVTHCLYRFHYGHEIPPKVISPESTHSRSSPFSRLRTRRLLQRLRVKIPRRVVVPLSATEISAFWTTFRTFRDLSLVALMLFNGLRSRETLSLKLDDLRLAQNEMLVHGKGNRQRLLPLDPQTIKVIECYLRLERPKANSPFLFLVLKGPHRGEPLTPAGLRTVFRYHRRVSTVSKANPHRFRHTFGADMVRAGISLPALMRLMGHAHIHTTMLYVQLSPQDVWREFYRSVQSRHHLELPEAL
jgi:site-specific recombinase XerD